MSVFKRIRSLNNVDLVDLDLEDIGNWPAALQVMLLTLLFATLLVTGFYLHIAALQKGLATAKKEEQILRVDFEQQAFEAANLEAYRAQLAEMEERFGVLVALLPSDTEVPGLLEDISDKGELNGLHIERIDLLDEREHDFYIELPIAIEAVGSYHDIGAFISDMAGLPRIVTLHDFQIIVDGNGSERLQTRVYAKTYRYREDDNEV